MNKDEVPQDKDNLNEGKLAKLYYATDKTGHYDKTNSIGWEAETVVMRQAWEVVNESVELARQQVLHGKASPILYFKEKNIMTYSMIADYMSSFSLVVWLHTKPFFFKKLSKETLGKYAYTFRISVDELLHMNAIEKK